MAERVQIALPEEDYAALSKLADEEDRTIAGQARHLLRKALWGPLGRPMAVTALHDPQSTRPDASPDPAFLQGEPETHDVTGNGDPDAHDTASQRDPLPG